MKSVRDRVAVMAFKRKKSSNPNTFLAENGEGRTIGKYHKGQIVFSQGDPADAVFYILKGQVRVTMVSSQGKEAVIAIHGAKNFFGQRCLAGVLHRIATVTTLTESSIMRIQKAAITRAIHEEPAFAEMFIVHLLNRSIRIEADLIDQLFNSSERRLARLLVLLANFDKEGKQDLAIIKITQEILAEKIGTTCARVNHFMNKFRRLGCIDYKGDIRVHRSLSSLIQNDQPEIRT